MQKQHIMNKRFDNQVAVITGGADGLGKGIAQRIAAEGGKIILLDINASLLERGVALGESVSEVPTRARLGRH